jgi:hypothetical protein
VEDWYQKIKVRSSPAKILQHTQFILYWNPAVKNQTVKIKITTVNNIVAKVIDCSLVLFRPWDQNLTVKAPEGNVHAHLLFT